jgi:hypothetical protein
MAILFTNQSLISTAIYATLLPHRRPDVYREPDRESLINALKIELNSAENIPQKAALRKSNSAQTV